MAKKRYIIRQYSKEPGEKVSTNDLEDAVRIASEKARNTKKPFMIVDSKNKEIAGIVKPNGEIKRSADSVIARSQNQAVNGGTIKIDKSALREMIREAVAKKLGNMEQLSNTRLTNQLQEKVTRTSAGSVLGKQGVALTKVLRESSDLGIGDYASKVDKLVSESIDSIDKLVEQGEELMKENPTHDYAIQERNHLVQARIGILKGLKTQLVRIMEDLYRKV